MDFATIRRVWLPLAACLFAITYMYKSAPGPHDWMRTLGLLIALVGLTGVIVSRYTLGRSFSIVPKATELVTTGIYSRIRNPIYVSGVLFLTGLFLMIRRPVMLVIFLVIIPMQILRARREAAVLEKQFGDAYREYHKRTWF
jgi:protein-S-isoprenylcysteine O-methyltransferase Ste14